MGAGHRGHHRPARDTAGLQEGRRLPHGWRGVSHCTGVAVTLTKQMIGQTFGLLTVSARSGSDGRGNALWKCTCSCGNELVFMGSDLRAKKRTSCGCASPKKRDELTAERLRDKVHYDPNTGLFRRRHTGPGVKAGEIAGSVHANGRIVFNVDQTVYYAHRLAWLYVHGVWPAFDVDHRNGDCQDNRIDNLRAVTRTVNAQNQRRAHSDNKTGLLGVSIRNGKPCAQITVNRRVIWLGFHATPEAAHQAYLVAKRRAHEGCTI